MEKIRIWGWIHKGPSVEWLFGIFKEQFQNRKRGRHQNDKNRRKINLNTVTYNLIQLCNIKQEIENTTNDLEDFCESTSIKN